MNKKLVDSRIIVAIPCYNEAVTIAKVVQDFQNVLPQAEVFVFDNDSTDGSGALALEAGAKVEKVRKRGKGHVLRAIFDRLDAEVVVIVDGDDTYLAGEAPSLIQPILDGEAEMVVGNRLGRETTGAMKRLHRFGNRVIVGVINRMFGTAYHDILSGYRAVSQNFIHTIPLLTSGFEIETELTLQALQAGMEVYEIPVHYKKRPKGSESKLRAFNDGYRIMLTSAILLRDHRPLRLFGVISLLCWFVALIAGSLYLLNLVGIVELLPAILVGTMLLFAPLGLIAFGIGFTLNAINTRFNEIKQIILRNQQRDG